jgi:predicted permease
MSRTPLPSAVSGLPSPRGAAQISRPVDEILHLLSILAPVFLLIALGTVLRRVRWLTPEADSSLLRLNLYLMFPALIFRSVVGNDLLREPRNLLVPPLLAFASMLLGWAAAWWTGRALGLERGKGLRTFAYSTGFYNYSYIPVVIVGALHGAGTLGVLFVYTIGNEFAGWTVGILLLAGGTLRENWRKALNPPLFALLAAIALNFCRIRLPEVVDRPIAMLGACAVPVGLLLIGATLEEHIRNPRALIAPRIALGSIGLRLGLLPLTFLAAAKWLPLSPELRQVLVVQCAMPAGVLPIVLTRHYGGQPLTAAQIVISTTVVSLFLIPLWMKFGLWWIAP